MQPDNISVIVIISYMIVILKCKDKNYFNANLLIFVNNFNTQIRYFDCQNQYLMGCS